ncbi:MAG TPA: hypothetical protein VHC46_04380, partial [Thermodesulfobacteriota bacterium]|nr:hypothetical protein [Thermodesulfobacteriota bacterium]
MPESDFAYLMAPVREEIEYFLRQILDLEKESKGLEAIEPSERTPVAGPSVSRREKARRRTSIPPGVASINEEDSPTKGRPTFQRDIPAHLSLSMSTDRLRGMELYQSTPMTALPKSKGLDQLHQKPSWSRNRPWETWLTKEADPSGTETLDNTTSEEPYQTARESNYSNQINVDAPPDDVPERSVRESSSSNLLDRGVTPSVHSERIGMDPPPPDDDPSDGDSDGGRGRRGLPRGRARRDEPLGAARNQLRRFRFDPIHFDRKLKPDIIEEWDGNPDSLVTWMETMNELSTQSPIVFEQLGSLVPLRLRKRAKEWYFGLSNTTRNQITTDWGTLRQAIRNHFMNRAWLERQKKRAFEAHYRDKEHPREKPTDYIYRKTRLLDLVVDFTE